MAQSPVGSPSSGQVKALDSPRDFVPVSSLERHTGLLQTDSLGKFNSIQETHAEHALLQ